MSAGSRATWARMSASGSNRPRFRRRSVLTPDVPADQIVATPGREHHTRKQGRSTLDKGVRSLDQGWDRSLRLPFHEASIGRGSDWCDLTDGKTRLSHLDLSAVRGGPPACPLRAGLLHPVVASSGQVSNGRYWRKADVEVGSRGSEMDATDVRCPLPSCAVPKARCRRRGDRRIPQERSTALRISDGVRWAACLPDPLCATRAVPDESAASTRSRSIDLSVGAFAGLIRKIGSRQTRGRTRLKALVHVVGTRTSDGTRYLRRLEHDLATRIMN